LPADKFSDAARNFVAGCLNKIPKLRPTYAMLLQHAWLAPLALPDTISEEDEEEAERAELEPPKPAEETNGDDDGTQWIDKEVGLWVREQIRKKKAGLLGKSTKPALHAAPLDTVPSPAADRQPANAGAVAV